MGGWHEPWVLGAATAALGLGALRVPLLAWFALTPLAHAAYTLDPPSAACAALIAGAAFGISGQTTPMVRRLMPVSMFVMGVSFAAAFGAASHLWPAEAVWLAPIVVPCAALLAVLPLRLLGAPRYLTNLLARSQESQPSVLRVARVGRSDLVLLALMGATSGALLTLRDGSSQVVGIATFCLVVLIFVGTHAFARPAAPTRTLRVAAVVADGPVNAFDLDHPSTAPSAVVPRYDPVIARASKDGARLIVLPEIAVRVDDRSRALWNEACVRWASSHGVTLVAPHFDVSTMRNELSVFGPDGELLASYEKQHPAPIEAPRQQRMGPAEFAVEGVRASAVICVDLDYGDLITSARRSALLVAPANDWPVFDELHHRTAVWSAVLANTPLVRATGHGISAVFDGSGRVLAKVNANSNGGTAVLVADVPIAPDEKDDDHA